MSDDINTFQSNFSIGEITPLLYARIDTDLYYKALRKARNVIQLPQGAVTRRFGLDFVYDMLGITDFTQLRLATFEFSSSEQYLLVFKPSAIFIFSNQTKELVATPVTVYTGDQIKELRFDQNLNQLVIVHPDVPPYQLSRGNNSSSWNIGLYVFKNVPTFDFNNNYSTITFLLSATSGKDKTLTASASIFTAADVGGTFTSLPGLAKIIAFTDSQHVTIDIYVAFGDLTVNGYDAILAEPAFSDTRGWPQSIAFYQSRLFFGGTQSLPQGLFGSTLNDYSNFLSGLGLPTDALILFLAGARLNSIQYLLNAVSLFIFTTGGVYATPPFTDSALTPSSARVDRQTSTGVQDNVPPFFIDNNVMYVQRGGRDIIAMSYNIQMSSYQTTSQALTAEHLIQNPVDSAKFEHAVQNQGTYSLFCNGPNTREPEFEGTLAVFQIITEEDIKAWTLCLTDGKFRRSVGLDDSVYFIVERDINGETKMYLECINFDHMMDSAIEFSVVTPTNIITGLASLENKTVGVISEGNYLGEYLVNSGQITVSKAITDAEVGLVWYPEVSLLPINIQTQKGNNLYIPKKLRQSYVHLHQSQSVYIEGIKIDSLIPGQYVLGAAPQSLNGAYKIPTSFGWDWDQELIITQDIPAPFTLLAISYQLES